MVISLLITHFCSYFEEAPSESVYVDDDGIGGGEGGRVVCTRVSPGVTPGTIIPWEEVYVIEP